MTEDSSSLARECAAFTRYLIGVTPTPYVVDRYVAAHAADPRFSGAGGRFESFLVRSAASSRLLRRPAAAYARIFAPGSALQSKLILLLGILESAKPSSDIVDAAPRSNPVVVVAELGVRGVWAVGALLVGLAVFGPARLVLGGEEA